MAGGGDVPRDVRLLLRAFDRHLRSSAADRMYHKECGREQSLRRAVASTCLQPCGDGSVGWGKLSVQCTVCGICLVLDSKADALQHACVRHWSSAKPNAPASSLRSSSPSSSSSSSPSSLSSLSEMADEWPVAPYRPSLAPALHRGDRWAILEARGILDEALRHGWQLKDLRKVGEGWTIPLFSEGGSQLHNLRWKRSGPGKPKYLWLSLRPHPEYYFNADIDLAKEIQFANGVLYVANGEPSTLAYRAAGLQNAVSFFGETSIPTSLERDLQRWGVQLVVNFFDNDDEGLLGSQNLERRVRALGIAYHGAPLPVIRGTVWPQGADINDVWVRVGCNRRNFLRLLEQTVPAIMSGSCSGARPPPGKPEGRTPSGPSSNVQHSLR
eukprot:GGOE01014077.1.p1 GENE.GGOE01014077.1~~GGOE01014077.1.p1  ORF type:complete len:437 (+),score=72.46 GGOE01014077.1:162-1313(+)